MEIAAAQHCLVVNTVQAQSFAETVPAGASAAWAGMTHLLLLAETAAAAGDSSAESGPQAEMLDAPQLLHHTSPPFAVGM